MLEDKTVRRDKNPTLWERAVHKLRRFFGKGGRERQNRYIRETLKDTKSFTLLTNNCIAGYFYHDAGREVLSPTVNLSFDGEDFIRFLEDPKKYVGKTINFIKTDAVPYPVGRIEDIEVRFVHYKSEKEAVEKWQSRIARMDMENVFVLATDHDGIKRPDLLARFDRLPYKNKRMYISDSKKSYPWQICVPRFKDRFQLKIMTNFANCKGIRYYEECFDVAAWIASGMQKPSGSQKDNKEERCH